MSRHRAHRLWRVAELQLPRRRSRRRVATSRPRPIPATAANFLWAYDFVFDACANGQSLKCLTIIDEFTRECLAIEVERHFTAADVVATLKYLFELRGAPRFVRSDNGPEFIARAVKAWLKDSGCGTLYIEPGSPWENAYVESFNGKFEDELLNRERFETLKEAKVLVEDHRLDYNHRRPHSTLGYLTPAAFAAAYRRKKTKKECREYAACGQGFSPPEDTKTHSPLSSGGGARISRKLS